MHIRASEMPPDISVKATESYSLSIKTQVVEKASIPGASLHCKELGCALFSVQSSSL